MTVPVRLILTAPKVADRHNWLAHLATMAVSALKTAIDSIRTIRQESDRAIVFFSCGKDSIALLHMVAPHFKEVVCIFMYFVPGLEHVERYLRDAARRYPNVRVIQKEHFILTSIRRTGMFCLPNGKQKILRLSDIDDLVRKETGINVSFYGSKKNDGLNRRLMLNSYGALPIQPKSRKAYPLADFSTKDVLAFIKQHRLPVPIKYHPKQSNAIGFNLECFLWMRENQPDDLERIYAQFPLSRKILFDYDNDEKHKISEVRDAAGPQKRTKERAIQSKEDKRLPAKGVKEKSQKGRADPAANME